MKMRRVLSPVRMLEAGLLSISLLGSPAARAQVSASLVAADSSVEPGKSFTVALRLTHQRGWHTSWINPGIGQPTSLSWRLPPGLIAGEIQWPAPRLIETAGRVTGHGYSGELLLPV